MSIRLFFILLFSLLGGPAARAASSRPDFDLAAADVLVSLKEITRIDSSRPPGETKVAEYLQAALAREGIVGQILEKEAGRGNFIARIKGSGRKAPLLLMAHSDVVGVEREKWTVDPFGAVEKDGFLLGRGVSDDKSVLAVFLQVVLQLKRLGVPLDRDIIFLAEAGEESSTSIGINFIVAEHWEKIDCEFALNEGGTIGTSGGMARYVGIATTEKLPRRLYLSAKGTSGHGSIPLADNAVVHLAAAVAKAGQWQTPVRLNETTRLFFQRLASISPPHEAWLYSHLEDAKVGAAVQEVLRLTLPAYNSLLRTSISPTVLKAGFQVNVIPGDALATLDIRALPDEDMTAFSEQLRRVINDPAVEIVPVAGPQRPAAPPSSVQSAMFQALEHAQQAVFPGAITLPVMMTGASDSAQLRAKGVQAYGVGTPVDIGTGSFAHGNDERIEIAGLRPFFEIVWRAVMEVAGAPQ